MTATPPPGRYYRVTLRTSNRMLDAPRVGTGVATPAMWKGVIVDIEELPEPITLATYEALASYLHWAGCDSYGCKLPAVAVARSTPGSPVVVRCSAHAEHNDLYFRLPDDEETP